MRKIFSKIIRPQIILPCITLLMLAGFIGSYIFPNEVLDTYVINMSEEEDDEEVLVPLSEGKEQSLSYFLDTAGRAMQGIQVGIAKGGQTFADTNLVYTVCDRETEVLLSDDRYALAAGDDLQYVYLPFSNAEACVGKLRIDFYLEGQETEGNVRPSLVGNHKQVKDVEFFDGTISETEVENPVSLKCNHIYSHNTYPFLYDCRIMTFVFLAVSMTLYYPKKNKVQGETEEQSKLPLQEEVL